MRKTFQQQIAENKRNSVILVTLMVILLAGLGALVGYIWFADYIMGGVLAVAITALFIPIVWWSGANMLLSFSGANEIAKADAPQLFNIVEEMSIAAGVPMPKVYVINSAAPNAFATGIDPQRSAVAITTGLMEKLNREEIQGVMAHEIGHIRNYDIRFSMLMSVLAGGVVIISDILLRSMFFAPRRSNNRDNNGAQVVMMLIGIVVAILAPLFATLIQLAMSRQREYLADASAVEFTRNPAGLASALAKLGGDKSPMESSKATAHMYVVNPKLGLRGGADSLFSTHPPIQSRIAKLQGYQGLSDNSR